jgi:hypothetical protein
MDANNMDYLGRSRRLNTSAHHVPLTRNQVPLFKDLVVRKSVKLDPRSVFSRH